VLSESEVRRLEELDREVKDQSKFIELEVGENAILEFDITRTVYKPDTYNGIEQDYPKHHFIARQLDCTNKAFRSFKPNATSGRKIHKFLLDNSTKYARIERVDIGKGKSEYVPSMVDDEDIERLK
jgi:hypothetical protein